MSPQDDITNTSTNRRRFLTTSSSLLTGALLGTGVTSAGDGVDDEDNTCCGGGGGYPIRIDYEDTQKIWGQQTRLTTNFHRHEADSLDTEDFWTIKCQVSADAEAHDEDDASDGARILYESDFEVTWDDQKYPYKRNVTAEISKDHIGKMDALYDGDGYDDGDIFAEGIKYGRDYLIGASPAGWLWSASTVVGSYIFDYIDNHDHQDSWGTKFRWGPDDWDTGVDQCSFWNRFDVELYEDQELELTLNTGTYNDYDILDIRFSYTVSAPSTSPSTVQKMSIDTRRKHGIRTIPAERVRRNPRAYGITGERLDRLEHATELYQQVGIPRREVKLNDRLSHKQ